MIESLIYWIVVVAFSGVVSYLLLFKVLPQLVKKKESTHTHSNTHSKAVLQELKNKEYSQYKGFKSLGDRDGSLSVDDIVNALKK